MPAEQTSKVTAITKAIDRKAMDAAITSQRGRLFQVLAIVRMAAQTIREPGYEHAKTDAWEALDGATELLCRVLDRLESPETMIAVEVRHGDY
jgi:hypothetical protein